MNFRTALLVICFASLTGAQVAYDFSLGLFGPKTATPGYPIFLQVESALADGADRQDAYLSVSGLPEDFGVSYPQLDQFCCGGNRARQPNSTLLRIDVPDRAAGGDYPIVLTMQSGGVTKSAEWEIHVVGASAPPVEEPSGAMLVDQWEEELLAYGATHCAGDRIANAGTWEGNIWFYDGLKVYHRLAERTGDEAWLSCADKVKAVYRGYVLEREGAVHGWRVFTEGLRLDYERTAEDESKQAVVFLRDRSTYNDLRGNVRTARSRETAFLLQAWLDSEILGLPIPEDRPWRYERALAQALGHLDQWARGLGDEHYQPFMVGLTMTALIRYAERHPDDPRILPAVQAAADDLWSRAWIESDSSFWYSSRGDKTEGAPDLNQLIAPGYAWVYAQTGDDEFASRATKLFNGGVKAAWLGGMKQFAQNYRDSFSTIRWLENK